MRWKGIIFIVLFTVLLVGLFYLLGDNWIEKQLENSLSEIHGAKVEIDNLDFSLFDLSIKWDRLQITNPKAPMKNIFETGKTGLDLEFMPLIRGKVVIDTLQFVDLKNNTNRTSSGIIIKEKKLKKAKKDTNKESDLIVKSKLMLKSKTDDYKNFRLDDMKSKLNIDSIMLATDLSSVDYIDSVEKSLEKRYKYWNSVVHSDEFKEDYNKIESEYNKLIKIDPKKIKTLSDLKKVLKKLKKAKNKLEKVNDKVKQYEKDFNKDIKNVRLVTKEIDKKIKIDYKEMENVAKIPNIDTKNISSFVFGETVVNRVNKFFEITELIAFYKSKLDKMKSEKEKPKSGKGQNIEFSGKYNYPDFWAKNIIFSGKLENQSSFKGIIKNIVSDQKLINNTTKATISGINPDKSSFDIKANIDTRTEDSFDSYKVNYSDMVLKNIIVSESAIFPYNIQNGKGQIISSIKISHGKYNGKLDFFGTEIKFHKNSNAKSTTEIQKFLDQSVNKLTKIDVKCKFSNDKISLNSNIDEIYNKEIKSYIDKNITKAKDKIRKEIDKKVNKAKSKFEKRKKSASDDIEKQINMINS